MSQIESMSIREQETQENQDKFESNEANISDHKGDHTSDSHLSDQNEKESENESLSALDIPAVDDSVEAREGKKKEKVSNPFFDAFLADLEKLPDSESRLQKSIEFMEASLAQNGSPHFKNFWEGRHICLQLFKENISPSARAQLWNKYIELSAEARRLKEILDEQSAFAAEQIEIAIHALEEDIVNFDKNIEKLQPLDFSITSQVLGEKIGYYQKTQMELNLLNTQASRINALRKELIKTEMRIRQKNKFFQRLSLAGDKVFPRRKDLIKEISSEFNQDVDNFIASNFEQSKIEDSLFFLREEIKALQGIAKLLTLNTHSFTHTRMCLSECWDKIKLVEKERKKARAQQKVVFKQSAEQVMEKIQSFKQSLEAGELPIQNAQKEIENIISFMRGVELGREELKYLREELANARKPLQDKIKAEEQEKLQQEQERESARKRKVQELKQSIEDFVGHLDSYEVEKLVEERDALFDRIASSGLNKSEKQELEKILKPLRSTIADAISDKKEKALMSLSEDDRQAIQQLKEVLEQRKERRQEIKNHLETIRKASGTSGFDFEQAMNYHAQINAEKERLEKINQGIKEIEDKLAQLKAK